MVQVLLLGPVVARGDDGTELDLGARARRAVLAALAEQPGRVVSVDALTDRLWGDSPPPTATNLLQGYVGKLRRVLGDAAIETHSPGYVLHSDTDATLFEDLVRRARRRTARGGPSAAQRGVGAVARPVRGRRREPRGRDLGRASGGRDRGPDRRGRSARSRCPPCGGATASGRGPPVARAAAGPARPSAPRGWPSRRGAALVACRA